uniref:Uncharacterized protein n=1 Tax=Panagrolaimus davidi TaxID=227884 RepID=A0A914R0E3_9BILA
MFGKMSPKFPESENSTKRQLSTPHDKAEPNLNQSGPDFGNVSIIPKFAQSTPIGSNSNARRRDNDNCDAINEEKNDESIAEELRSILNEDLEDYNSAQLITYRQKLSMRLQNAFNETLNKNDFNNDLLVAASAKITQLDNSVVMLRELRRVGSNKQVFEKLSQGDKQLRSNSHGWRRDDIVYPPVPDHSLIDESTAGQRHDLNSTAFGIQKQLDRIKIGANKIIVQKAKEEGEEFADLEGKQ